MMLRTIAMLALALSIAIFFLSKRNLYDDELGSFRLFEMPVSAIWQEANSTDFHPPGMYILGRISLRLTGQPRGAALACVVLFYTGLFLFACAAQPVFGTNRLAATLFLAVLFLHPHLLMWSTSA